MVVTEESVGITAFVSPHEGFEAVVKQRYQDFIVREISRDGIVADITDLGESLPDASGRKRASSDVKDGSDAKELSPEELEKGFEELGESLGEELMKLIKRFVNNETQESKDESQVPYLTYPMQEKERRTTFHKWCSKYLPSYITDTVMEDAEGGNSDSKSPKTRLLRIRPRTKLRPWKRTTQNKRQRLDDSKSSNIAQSNAGKNSDNESKTNEISMDPAIDAHRDDTYDPRQDHREDRVPPSAFVSFVLQKENTDTTEAVLHISRLLRLQRGAVSYSGTKDKRALTFQQMRIRGISPPRLYGLNKLLRRGRSKMSIGNVQVCSGKDNKALKLGDLTGNRFNMCLRDLSLLPKNKMNASGQKGSKAEQNIKNFNSRRLKCVALSAFGSLGKHGFINYFGLQRFGSGAIPTHETGFAVLAKKYDVACKLILQPVLYEYSNSRKSSSGDVANTLKQFHEGAIDARRALDQLPKYMNIERKILESYDRNKKSGTPAAYDHKAAFSALPLNLRKLYVHAVQSYLWNRMASARVSVSRSHYAIEGDVVPYDTTVLRSVKGEKLLGSLETRTVSREEAEKKSVKKDFVILPLVGKGTSAAKIEGKWGQVCRDEIEKHGLDFDNSASELGLLGGWRRLIAKPSDKELRFVSYDRFDEDLIKKSKAMEEYATKIGQDGRTLSEYKRISGGERTGVILSFSLGVAEYATMCVRELTKMDSSVASQIKVQEKANGKGAGKEEMQEEDQKETTGT
eukprot:Plantae.Rhodophyta-Hildenbrandia_rubra.ctg5992.p1 GENE.Plantae.Rhodophyta-Hildenbrandia_rubra.ctg5992~~Plantae.Rhodophyta-Hildenbrandia_rubra.ctg5992.p1  ORF type:complete len:744 (+),score=146.75 Plantae.Rhodophyta-Hildenbrandia_rubra.ctg5992:3721-5952(+)